jgi:hypothetical protein
VFACPASTGGPIAHPSTAHASDSFRVVAAPVTAIPVARRHSRRFVLTGHLSPAAPFSRGEALMHATFVFPCAVKHRARTSNSRIPQLNGERANSQRMSSKLAQAGRHWLKGRDCLGQVRAEQHCLASVLISASPDIGDSCITGETSRQPCVIPHAS